MARLVSPDRPSSAPVTLPSDFYREELMRHRACLAAQREYWRREFEQALVETLAAAGCSPELARLIAGPAAVDVPRSR